LKKNENIRSLQNICTWTINPQDILTQIRKEVWEYAGIVRVESELLALREKLKNFREEINTNGLVCSGDTYTNIMMYNRVHTVLDLAELICKWALLRQESRGAHYRSDFREMEEKYAMNLLHTIVEWEVSSIWKELPSASTRIQKWLDSFEEPNNYGHSE
jgi:succinate dehydrogenase/fumarate reductase flavoprotein subunit